METQFVPSRAMDLKEFNKNDSLIKRKLTVEAVMRHFAGLRGE